MTEQAKRQNDQAPYYFHQGASERAYEYLGAHRTGETVTFRVWAPNADSVSVVGDFCDWATERHPMRRVTDGGIWECGIDAETVPQGSLYKYFIRNGEKALYKADPYGVSMQCPPETASVYRELGDFDWHDSAWLKFRKGRYDRAHIMEQPLNIYEIHPASWKRHEDGSVLTYIELADELAPYVKAMGYTHVELMPVAEHPFDGSWGYQVCGYYAPTARFGTPNDFRAFVDRMHTAGVGVILDWVPAHFPKDAHGLYEFDGQPLYEYQGRDRMEHAGWGTRRFDVGREEVQSFLISNAVYWAEEYHIDGLRVDAVASMLYLDYDKRPGEWIPNIYGGNQCLEAIAFFQKLNSTFVNRYPDVMTIAEESTAWANITGFENGGLGFTLKWNMGWMNDTLAYAVEDPLWRCDHHERMTFSLTYAFSERYILPISHDEVVHGKKSFLDRMPGDYDQKFAGARVFFAWLMTHPGKKLTFMGSEIGQFREWDYAGSVEWFLLDYDKHAALQRYVAQLGQLYLATPALWQCDRDWSGFEWIDADDRAHSILSYRRKDAAGKELIVLLNFQPVRREAFPLAVPYAGQYEEIFSSDAAEFGGGDVRNMGILKTEKACVPQSGNVLRVTVPPMSALFLRCVRRSAVRRRTDAKTKKA